MKMEEIRKIEIGETVDNEKKPHKLGKWLVIPPVIFLVFALILVIPGVFVFNSAKAVVSESQSLKEAFKTKDLNLISQKIVATKKSVESLERSLLPYSWLGVIPWVGNYEQDAVHLVKTGKYGLETGEIIIEAIKPYADLLGFAGGTQLAGGEKTAEGRITLLVATLDKITPDLDRIAEKAKLAQKETGQINPRRYPVEFRGQKIREPLTELISLVNEGATLASDAKPLLVNASWFLGNETPRRYLLLLQNDGELRPTGGFITAYAILEVDKGRIKPVLSEDIYALDNKYKPTLQAPEALRSYVPFPYSQDPKWRLRDMNLSPDFAVSMQTFLPEFQKAAKLKYDGVIAVDTEVLVKFLVALGQIGVPGWGNFSAVPDKNCDGCPQVVYELEKLITKPLNKVVTERKAVLGPLMHSILANAMGSPKEKLPGLFDAVFASAQEKHVLRFVAVEIIQ